MEGKYSHFAECSKEELQEIGHRGGTNSGKARRKKANARKAAEILLAMPLTNPEMLSRLEEVGELPEDAELDNMMATVVSVMLSAWGGDHKAAKLLLEIIGQGPTQNINANITNNHEELKGILEQLKE